MTFKKVFSALSVVTAASLIALGAIGAGNNDRALQGTAVKNGSGYWYIPTTTPTANRVIVTDGSSVPASSSVTSSELGLLSTATPNLVSFELVKRDASGGFSAGPVNIIGTLTANGTVNTPTLTASLPVKTDASKNLVSSQLSTSDIGNNQITNSVLAQMPANTIKGNNTGSPADPLDLTASQTTAMLDNFVGDSGSGGTKGLVPAPASGDTAANKFLKASGLWDVPVSGATSVSTIDSQTKSSDGGVISGNNLYFQTADSSYPGLVSIGSQTFAGIKTFSTTPVMKTGLTLEDPGVGTNYVSFEAASSIPTSYKVVLPQQVPSAGQVLTVTDFTSNVATTSFETPSASGATTVGSIDSQTKSANGGVISGNNLYFQTADATYPGLVSTSAQTFAGEKTLNAPLVVANQGSTPSNPSSGNTKIYVKTNGRAYKLDSSGNETELGSGGGSGINLVVFDTAANNYATTKTDNFNAETTVGDWAAYADAAGTAPVDMTGGSPNTTCARNTSSPLNGAGDFLMTVTTGATRQGEGCSLLVNVPPAYRGKLVEFRFPFSATGTITDGDFSLYAYDVTNSAVIQPYQAGKILGSSGMASGVFSVPTTATQIRVGIHIARASNTGAVTVNFDDVQVSPYVVAKGLAGSDLLDYTPASTQGFGTPTLTRFQYARRGDALWLFGKFTTGTVVASEARISLPAGLLVDATKVTALQTVAGFLSQYTGGSLIQVVVNGGNNYINFTCGTAGTGPAAAQGSACFASSSVYTFAVGPIPISGWSSNVSMAESSTFWISTYLANGSRITGSAPTSLGQYRSYLRNAGASTFTETNGSPGTAPSATNGILIYGGNQTYATGDASNAPSRFEIFVGKSKNVRAYWFLNTGKTGYIDVTPYSYSSNNVGYTVQYDPATGIVNITSYTNQFNTGTHYVGTDSTGSTQASATSVYFDLQVSENALAVGVNGTPRMFSAHIDSAGTTITRQIGTITPWLSSCTKPTTGEVSCTIAGGIFSSAPNCVISQAETSNATGKTALMGNTISATAFNYYTYLDNGSAVDRAVNIICVGN